MPHANSMSLCFIKPELLSIEVWQRGTKDFRPFLLLWPWPWPNDLHIRTWPLFPGDIPDVQIRTSYVKAFESYRLTDRQTRPKLDITPLRRWPIIIILSWEPTDKERRKNGQSVPLNKETLRYQQSTRKWKEQQKILKDGEL